MGSGHAVAVKGLRELVRDLGRVDKSLRKEVQRELDNIGKGVRDMVRAAAEDKGLRNEGKLISGVRHRVKNYSTVVVRSTRKRDGYDYPALYEFGGSHTRANAHGVHFIKKRSAAGKRLMAGASSGAQGRYGAFGPRAFAYPTIQKAIPYTTARLEVMLARLLSANGLAGGGTWSGNGHSFTFGKTEGVL